MPTASTSMVEKLAADAKVMSDALEKLQKALDKLSKPASQKDHDALVKSFGPIDKVVQIYAANVKLEPPKYPDEDAYKILRKGLTGQMAKLPKLVKLVEADKSGGAGKLTFKIDPEALKDLKKFKGSDDDLIQAFKLVARGDAGRSGPKQDGVEKYSHIHIGGQAKMNLLYRPAKSLVLGYLGFHLQKDAPKEEKEAIKEVASRKGTAKAYYVDDEGYGPK
jgi:hypothetical protein